MDLTVVLGILGAIASISIGDFINYYYADHSACIYGKY